MEEISKMKGSVEIKVIGPDGIVKSLVRKNNLIVTVGKAALATWLAASSQSGAFMPYTAVGSGTTTPAISDTALQTEVARVANAPSASTNVLSFAAVYGPGVATGAISEAGLLSAVSAGTLFSHVVFSVQNISSGDTLNVNWSVTFS